MFSSVIERLNDRRDAAGDAGADAGFTLIELMVVLLILAILLAIAIPTFLGVTGGANDRAAQANLNTALTNAKAAASEANQTYGGVTVAILKTNEPAINWVAGAIGAAGQGPVSTYLDPAANGGNGVVLASWSKNAGGTCWYAVDNLATVTIGAGTPYNVASGPSSAYSLVSAPNQAGTYYGQATGVADTACSANDTPALAGITWGTSFP
jgi:type IV pilus assembly protein PilA